MPVRGGVAILVGWGAVGTPVGSFIPVVAAAGVASIFACWKIEMKTMNETTYPPPTPSKCGINILGGGLCQPIDMMSK